MQVDQVDHRWLRTHRFAVIDASRRDEVPVEWPCIPIAPAFLGADTDRCPVLLNLQRLPLVVQADFLDQLGEEVSARESTVASLLLATEVSEESLLKHLTKRMVLILPSSQEPKQFRYFDPGTFLQLPRYLGARGMAWLLGPVTSVWVPWAGEWGQFECPAAATGFRMSGSQLQALFDISVLNRVALQLDPPSDQNGWCETCAAIEIHLKRGRAHGLNSQKDLVGFCSHAMQWHPQFDEHPEIQQLLKALEAATPADELNYVELSRRIPMEQWHRIQTELGQELVLKDTPP